MAVDSSSKVIIEVDLLAQDANDRAVQLGKSLQQLKDANKQLADANQKTSVAYVKNQQAIQQLTREQKNYVNLANAQSGSNVQLRAQLSLLTQQYDHLSKAERDSTTAGKALQLQISAINKEVSANEQKTGRFQRNVGNYANQVGSGIQQFGGGSIANTGFGGFATQAASGAVTNFVQTIGFVTQAVKDQATANELSVISTQKATEATEAQTAADVAAKEAAEAKLKVEEAELKYNELKAASDEQLFAIKNQLIAAEEREAAIELQLQAARAETLAATELRIASEEAETAAAAELVAANEALAASQVQVAAQTAAAAAASTAAASKTSVLSSSFKVLGTLVLTVVAAIGAATLSALSKADSFADGFEQWKDKVGGAFTEFGRQVATAYDSGGIGGVFKKIFTDFGSIQKATKAAGQEMEHFTEIFQNLRDLKDVNEISNQQVQNEVQLLRIQARNRKLSNDDKQAKLAEADKIEADQFEKTKGLHATIIAESVEFAQTQAKIKNSLNAEEKKELRNGNIQLANNLLNADRISVEGYKKLKEGYADRNADLQQANTNLEKIQNDQDKYAEKAAQAAAKRAEDLKKLDEDTAKSKLETAKRVLTQQAIDLQEVNLDINKREELYKKYGRSTEQLELERQSRISAILDKGALQNKQQVEKNLNDIESIRINGMQDSLLKEQAQRAQANKIALQDTDNQIFAIAGRMALGEQGLTDLLQSYVDKRNAIVEQGNNQRAEDEVALTQRINDARDQAAKFELQYELDDLKFQQDQVAAKIGLNEQLIESYGGLAEAIGGAFEQGSVVAKAAFVLEKGFAIAKIILNAELEKSNIRAAAAEQAKYAAAIPFVGGFVAAGIIAAGEILAGQVTTREALSVAAVAATTITGIVGKEKGGIQYNSDGQGTILPGYSKKDNMNARLRDGEAVIVSEAARDPHTRSVLSAINVAYGGRPFDTPGYATGGVYGGSFLQTRGNDIASQVQRDNLVSQQISNLRIFTAITEINDGQSKYAQIVDAGNV